MKLNILFIAFILCTNYILGQPGTLDSTFGNNGIVTTSIRWPGDEHGNAVAIDTNGIIYVAGYSVNSQFMSDFATVSYNPDGSLNNSFGINGKVITDNFGYYGSSANAIAIQANGRIVVAGGAQGGFAVVRYDKFGYIDYWMGSQGLVTTNFVIGEDIALALAIQSDGKIVAAGMSKDTIYYKYDFAIARYNYDLSLDSFFGINGKVITDIGSGDDYGKSVSIQQDGKIVVAGYSSNDFAVVRYNTNGSLDSTFGTNGVVITDFNGGADDGYSVAIQTDQKIIVAGTSSSHFALARYNTDGSLDNSFGISGITITSISDSINIAHSIAIQPDGKIVTAGEAWYDSTYANFAVVRYNPNGFLDSTFGSMGKVITVIGDGYNIGNSVAIQSDGKIIVAGVSYTSSGIFGAEDVFTVVRYLSTLNTGVVDFSDANNSFFIYPNPIEKDANLEYTLLNEEILSIGIYDINGRLVKTIFINESRSKGTHKEILNIEELQAGIYILAINNNSRSQNIKIIKK